MQNIRQAVTAAAMQPKAAKTPPGNSSNFRAVPHSSSDSSKPDGQLWWPHDVQRNVPQYYQLPVTCYHIHGKRPTTNTTTTNTRSDSTTTTTTGGYCGTAVVHLSLSVVQVVPSPKETLCNTKRTRSDGPASKRYKQVRFLAPPRPKRKTFRGTCTLPFRLRNTREQSGGIGSSPRRPGQGSPPCSVSTNS
uniref:Uncharacterized protein n=1 Tax=Glossina palpalis gambiensis TaxID=67801 RepID=A0A1B0BCI5_9MUSC